MCSVYYRIRQNNVLYRNIAQHEASAKHQSAKKHYNAIKQTGQVPEPHVDRNEALVGRTLSEQIIPLPEFYLQSEEIEDTEMANPPYHNLYAGLRTNETTGALVNTIGEDQLFTAGMYENPRISHHQVLEGIANLDWYTHSSLGNQLTEAEAIERLQHQREDDATLSGLASSMDVLCQYKVTVPTWGLLILLI